MRKQIILQLKSVNKVKVIFELSGNAAPIIEYSGAHAIGYFNYVEFQFLRSEHLQLRTRI